MVDTARPSQRSSCALHAVNSDALAHDLFHSKRLGEELQSAGSPWLTVGYPPRAVLDYCPTCGGFSFVSCHDGLCPSCTADGIADRADAIPASK
jgi:hypothetical protein